jgi:protein SCO1/2
MPAMTMPYEVKDPEGFGKIQPADTIRADVVVAPGNKFWLEHVVVTGKGAARSSGNSENPHFLAIGDTVPDIPLINQDGKTLKFGQFKGKAVLFTFIYTRCPFPKFCPLLSTEFAEIHRELSANPEEMEKTHLVSITLDPANDTPSVLREYGLTYLKGDPSGFRHWDFVSTTPADLKKLAGAFGVAYFGEDNLISHSMNTILLAPDGTVATMWPENEWQVSEVLAVLRHSLPNRGSFARFGTVASP